jgi:predicted nucleic acid-binding protein
LTLIDAYGLVALVAEEPSAREVEGLLRKGDCGVVALNLAEAVDISQRIHGLSPNEVRQALEPLILSGVVIVEISGQAEAWLAADIRAKHYDRTTCSLSMADCFLLAHALVTGDDLATSDPDLARVARAEGATVIALADRSGARPDP